MSVFRCGQCRVPLPLTSHLPSTPVTSRTADSVTSEVTSKVTSEDATHFFVSEPWTEWIETKIEEVGWTKGKLSCPKCGCHLGGFDFVGGRTNSVHLVKSKVDLHNKIDLEQVLRAEQSTVSFNVSLQSESCSSAAQSSVFSASASNPSNSTSTLHIESYESSPVPVTSTSESSEATPSHITNPLSESLPSTSQVVDSNSPSTTNSSLSGSDYSNDDYQDSDRSSNDSSPSSSLSSRKKKKLKRRRKEKVTMETKLNFKTQDSQDKLQEILNAEPELNEVDDSLICPVCLDLLHEPFLTLPCRHVFCEPCLRRLGSKNAMNTLCPLCRTRIAYCDTEKTISASIREKHMPMYQKRKQLERSTNVYTLPLPWRPGWRNLLSGRAMGGNHFQDLHGMDYFRRILRQLPYYIPPVMIANLFNLLFLVFLVGALEIVPLLLTALLRKHPKYPSPFLEEKSMTSAESIAKITPAQSFLEYVLLVQSKRNNDLTTNPMSEPAIHANDDLTENDIPLPPTYIPTPEMSGLALDATLYYVMCSVSLFVAAFGNFLLIHQHRGMLGNQVNLWPFDRFVNFFGMNQVEGNNQGFRQYLVTSFGNFCLLLFFTFFPLIFFPAIIPLTKLLGPDFLETLLGFVITTFEFVQTYFFLSCCCLLGTLYWIGTIHLEEEEEEEMFRN